MMRLICSPRMFSWLIVLAGCVLAASVAVRYAAWTLETLHMEKRESLDRNTWGAE